MAGPLGPPQLQAASDAEATATAITGMAELPSGHLLAIAS